MPNDAKVCITGNLTKDPTHKVYNNQMIVSFTVAVNTTLKKEDNSGYESNFYNVSIWGKPGEWLLEKLQKGTQVDVFGELFLQKYTNQAGVAGQSLNIKAYSVTPRAKFKTGPSRRQDDSDSLPDF